MVSLSMDRSRLLSILAMALLLGVLPAVSISGQELPWLRGGQIRLDASPSFWAWDSRFGYRVSSSGSIIEETEPLGVELNQDPLGTGPFPYLQELEGRLREALQDQSYGMRLGAGYSVVEQSRLTLPIRLDAGVTDWLTVGAMVPFHRPRTEIDFLLDADSTNANVGLSPQLTPAGAGAVAGFVTDYQAVLDLIQETDPDNPNLQEATGFLTALGAAYSHGTLFPLSGTPAGTQLQARLDEIRAALEAQGFTGMPQEVPLAETYLDQEGFNAFLASRGMQAFPLEDWTHIWSMGDVEISAEARVLRSGFDPDSMGNLPNLRYQAGVGGLLRLATGGQADPNRFFDLDPADGQTDLEASAFGLLEYGRWLGAWGRVRYGIQMEGTAVRRIAGPSEVLPSVFSRAPMNWTPGNYLDVELSPRFYLTREMTFGVRYHLWLKGEDKYSLQPIESELIDESDFPPPSLLEMETEQTLQEVAFSATYSTVGANDRGETPIPMMIRASYFHPLAGSGGQTPKGGRLQIGITVFRTLWGGGGDRNPQPEGPTGR